MKDQQYVPIALSDEQRQHHVDPTTNRLGKPMIGYEAFGWLADNTRDSWQTTVSFTPKEGPGLCYKGHVYHGMVGGEYRTLIYFMNLQDADNFRIFWKFRIK